MQPRLEIYDVHVPTIDNPSIITMELDDIPFDALVFLACWKCSSYPKDNSDTALQRCGGCKRIMYCSSGEVPCFEPITDIEIM